MAGEFLRSHGIDIEAEMARIQDASMTANLGPNMDTTQLQAKDSLAIQNVSLPNTDLNTRWDVSISNGKISDIHPNDPDIRDSSEKDGQGALLAPSLCHPHVHIDKAYLLSHPKYAHLQIERGDFQEAMELTTSAKKNFSEDDLLERGQRLIDESVDAGVTHMRAFVEVDSVVGMKCLQAGIELKRKAEQGGRCIVQLCTFAQLPLFSSVDGDESGEMIRSLMSEAASKQNVDVVGSTPYVEGDQERMKKNIEWLVDLSIKTNTHIDFHLDYHLDPQTEPMVWHVLKVLKDKQWQSHVKNRTIVLGHCTRLTHFNEDEWRRLQHEIGELPVSFVGLPTSDLFMMRTPERTRGTLDVPKLIKDYELNACVGINNIGNAFTPQGSCDPLTLACNGVGIYQAGTKQGAELLYECVSTRARRAIGLEDGEEAGDSGKLLELKTGIDANLILFASEKQNWRTRKTVAEVVYLYDHARGRGAYLNGRRANAA